MSARVAWGVDRVWFMKVASLPSKARTGPPGLFPLPAAGTIDAHGRLMTGADSEKKARHSWEVAGRAIARAHALRRTILVVDDDLWLLDFLEKGLALAGYDVTKASGGIDALSCLYARRPDVMLVDLAMPRMNGVELIAQVCAEPRFRPMTVLAMSGHDAMLEEATNAGAVGVMIKPVSIDENVAAHLGQECDERPQTGRTA